MESVKNAIKMFEEANNEYKDEKLWFGSEESENIRMLGVWMGAEKDNINRVKRAGGLWAKVRSQLRGSHLTLNTKAHIVSSCVESVIFFDCGTRTLYQKDIKYLQRLIDRCYRHIWANGRGPPLRRMQERHLNMQDLRNRMGVKTIRWHIERDRWKGYPTYLELKMKRAQKLRS